MSKAMKINIGVLAWAVLIGAPLFIESGHAWVGPASQVYVLVIIVGFLVAAVVGLIEKKRLTKR